MRNQNISVATSIVVITEDQSKVLLIKRLNEPFKDKWALPGGFMENHENAIHSAHRELREETTLELDISEFCQLLSFDGPDRDPRGHVIDIPFTVLVHDVIEGLKAEDDAKELGWFELSNLPELAFDHKQIIGTAILYHLSRKRYSS